jgi:preprotein translocase subunit SecA
MVQKVLAKIFGTQHEREMKRLQPLVDQINSFEPAVKALTDDQLKAKTPEFKKRLQNGETLDDILPEAFAVCREASVRVLGMRHYDVQLIGGLVLHQGKISEMRTGEGKTLVATLPVYLNALSGEGVHVVTVNDYLAKRDSAWMGQLYNWLGLSVGIIVHELSDKQRRDSYGSDITYGTNNEFGFDYLRDNMKFDLADYVQRPFNFAIVDECDSILVDEARTPLIISGPAEESTDKYGKIDKIIPSLKKETHFTIEEKSKSAVLTEEGNTKVEELLGIENLYDPNNIDFLHHVTQALRAHHLYKVDVDYMIKDGQVIIVDEFTGRLMEGRRWSDGLHQAIEAKEGVKVKNENQTLATVTFQNYFRMYKKLAGMTGTAETEAVEFKKIYNLDVVVIPTNKDIKRKDKEDIIFKTELAKFKAISLDIQERHKAGQPILVGTVSIDKSEKLSSFLKNLGVKHNVLNAKHHEREAEIVAQAGRKGAVTIATNMAGRGTDIVLGGNSEFLAKAHHSADESVNYEELLKKYKEQTNAEKEEVVQAGGLYIIGTERHESRRIDNQLRGRAGRQGDPGASLFYLSLDDHLMVVFNGERIKRIMTTLKVPEDEPITAPMVTRAIEGAQKKVEGHNFDIRKHLLDYDDVMNQQRSSIYGMRRKVLEGGEPLEQITKDMMGDLTSALLDTFVDEKAKPQEWNLEGLNLGLNQQFGVDADFKQPVTIEDILERTKNLIMSQYEKQKNGLGPLFEQAQKMILLQAIDQKWKEHLQRIDHLREGINLRAYAQKDPLIEYKTEAFSTFEETNHLIKSDALEKLFKIQVRHEYVQQAEEGSDVIGVSEEALEGLAPRRPQRMSLQHDAAQGFVGQSAPSPAAPQRIPQPQVTQVNQGPKVGRNDPCPCGSGKKYKKCHGSSEQ